jgi:hypothetical protein
VEPTVLILKSVMDQHLESTMDPPKDGGTLTQGNLEVHDMLHPLSLVITGSTSEEKVENCTQLQLTYTYIFFATIHTSLTLS